MTELPDLRRMLLALLHPGPLDLSFAQLDDEDWSVLNAMAAEHRLQPLLHAEWIGSRGETVPDAIRASWAAEYRASGFTALSQKGALLSASQTLKAAGIASIALKGAWLAWYAYPAAALRPMRDVALVVDENLAITAWRCLQEAGYDTPFGSPDNEAARRDKHLPPLLSPNGTVIEVHGHFWENAAEAGHAMPPSQDAALFARARAENAQDPLCYPAPEDMFAHLVIHAAYSHWLDAGPLVLVDLDFVLRISEPDWPALWRRAEAEGWIKGAVLLMSLTDRWRRPGLLEQNGCPERVPVALLNMAPDLLLQSMERRAGARIMARIGRDGIVATLAAKLAEAADDPVRSLQLVGRRVGDAVSGLVNAAARRKSRQMRDLGNWLLAGQ